MFNKLKKVLLTSGYRVILTDKVPKGRGKGFASGIKGYIVPDDLKIFINKKIGINDRVETLIHELLHEIYPAWAEKEIDAEAKRIFRSLNISQLGYLQFFIMTPQEVNTALKSNHLSPKFS
ncbi:MAG: hypothetical protein U9M89_01100 [Patescibacteria group bacterium]|nr:hypothetical protein [Patescibacteria group bacterium]